MRRLSLIGLTVLFLSGIVSPGGVPGVLPALRGAKFNRVLDIGDPAPQWKNLPGTDGRKHSLSDLDGKKAVIVVFTCNHCPVAKAYRDRLNELAEAAARREAATVAISVSLYRADRLEAMKEVAEEQDLPYPYLHDASQDIGRAYGALCTPHVFLLDEDRRIAYMGKIDDSMYPEKVTERFLPKALNAVLSGEPVEVEETKPAGCPIDYETNESE